MIVDRKDMRDQLHELLSILTHKEIAKQDTIIEDQIAIEADSNENQT